MIFWKKLMIVLFYEFCLECIYLLIDMCSYDVVILWNKWCVISFWSGDVFLLLFIYKLMRERSEKIFWNYVDIFLEWCYLIIRW